VILRGRVSGHPPSTDVRLHGFALRTGSPVSSGVSGADGSFELPLPDGPAVVFAYAPWVGAAALRIEDPSVSVELRLRERFKTRGRVVGPDGAPLDGVLVSQIVVFSLDDALVYVTIPLPGARVEKRGTNVYLVPSHCSGGVTTSDVDGRFLLECFPPADGKIHVRLSSGGDTLKDFDSVWIDASAASSDVVLSGRGPFLRLPDGSAVDNLPADESGRPGGEPPLPPAPTDPREERRARMVRLRDEATRESAGHPPKGRSRRTDLLPDFVRGLDDSDHEVRTQAICALAYMNAPEALEPLLGALKHSDWTVRWYAVMGLEWLGLYSEIRARVVAALRRIVDERVGPESLPLAAAEALVQLGEPQDPALFFEALREDGADVYMAAAALAKFGRRDAIELILRRMENADNRHLLGKALEELTGQAFGESVARWASWLEANRSSLPPQAPISVALPTARAYCDRAHDRMKRKDVSGALADLDAALILDPTFAPAFVLRASVRMNRGDLDGALADADRAVEIDPEAYPPWSMRARVRERRGDLAGAAEDLRKALASAPPESKVIVGLRERLRALERCARCGVPGPTHRVTESGPGGPHESLLCAACAGNFGAPGKG
jgi:tetratricopeptide (TPR) repeat protein